MPQSSTTSQFDVIIASDFRLPGGTTSSIAEEVKAQSAAGITTGLLHLAGSVTNYAIPWSKHIEAVIDLPGVHLLTSFSKVRANLMIIRHPLVAFSNKDDLSGFDVDNIIIVANHAAVDGAGKEHYNISNTDDKIREVFGVAPIWAPIGPVVRNTMRKQTQSIPFRKSNWSNIFAFHEPNREWEREKFVSDVPVIGRHSRPQPGKWPATATDILSAYPESGPYRVRILGGAGAARKHLGYVPEPWEVIPFGGMDPSKFLQGIDFWVYMHHPDLREAFGRAAMEALAAGCVAIMPPYMEELFGNAALYADPRDVIPLVDEFYRDPELFLDQSRRAQEFARGFTPQMHIERLAEFDVEARSGESGRDPLTLLESVQEGLTDLNPGDGAVALIVGDGAGPDPWMVLGPALLPGREHRSLEIYIQSVKKELSSGHSRVIVSPPERMNMPEDEREAYIEWRLGSLLNSLRFSLIVYSGSAPSEGVIDAIEKTAAQRIWLRTDLEETTADVQQSLVAARVAAERRFHSVIDEPSRMSL